MKWIQYRVTFGDSRVLLIDVVARDLNSGFGKALDVAKSYAGGRELNKIEFWMVMDGKPKVGFIHEFRVTPAECQHPRRSPHGQCLDCGKLPYEIAR